MMYATNFSLGPLKTFSSGPVRQASSITRRQALLAGAAALVSALPCTDLRAAAPFDSTQDRPFDSAQGKPWREAPEYVGVFTPRAHRDAYRTYRSPLGLDETLQALLTDPGVEHPPGAWQIQTEIPFDAFGRAGSYNRWQLAGLYGSRRVRVARGPRIDGGQAESWTLVAPYPDPALRRLEPGTLIIVLRIPQT